MFKKKPTIKPLAPLRSSDRRKTADSIIAEYGLWDSTKSEDKAAATAETTALRNALLPEGVQIARFTTTHGPDLRQVSGTVYVGAYTGDDMRVLWIKLEDRMYPTVYTLWKHAGIVPLLHTPAFVVQKLQGGADLMTPGLANGPPFHPKATKGAVVAIASLEQPSVPVAVGACLIDISSLGSVQASRGHAVQTMHWAGDDVWAYSTSNKPGITPPGSVEGWISSANDQETLAEQTADLAVDDDDQDGGGVNLNKSPAGQPDPSDGLGEDAPSQHHLVEKVDIKDLTAKEIDDAFRKAFIYGVYNHKETNTNHQNYGLEYPLSQSFVMSNLVQPFLPTHNASQASSLQIKKSSYKNIKKFIKSLEKAKLVKTKERDQHETMIILIDFNHDSINDFVPYRLPKKENTASTNLNRSGKEMDTNDTSIGQKLERIQYYKINETLLPIFSSISGSPPNSLFTATEIKPILTNYIESEKLTHPTNKRLISLTPILSTLFTTSPQDQQFLSTNSIPRDILLDRILKTSTPYYTITTSLSTAPMTPTPGFPPPLLITLVTRTGNKTATKLSGLEPYSIAPHLLADELKKSCAGSCSVDRLLGSSAKIPVLEIMVQGPQKHAVLKALEKRGVKAQWVDVVDKTKGKKK